MMPGLLQFIFFTSFALLCHAEAPPSQPKPPNFDCSGQDGASYRIWIGEKIRVLQVANKGKTREIPLTAANLWRVAGAPGRPLVYNAWNLNASTPLKQLDMSNEFSTHYLVEGGVSRLNISLVLDHRELTVVSCKALSYPGTVITSQPNGSAAKRFGNLLNESASLRRRDGSLTPAGILGVETAVQRMFHSPGFSKSTSVGEFATEADAGIKKIAPQSIALLRSRFTGVQTDFWNSLITKAQYLYHPEVNRYATWITEGCRPYPNRSSDSVHAGFRFFVESAGYRAPDIRQFFISEVTPALKDLSETEINQVKERLGSEATTFLTSLWAKSQGKRTLADYPNIEQMATEIGTLVNQTEFDPQTIQAKLESFLKLPVASDSSAHALFVQAASVHIRKLTPRQREDVRGWCQGAEKELLAEMFQ